jgi:hypothetical protein
MSFGLGRRRQNQKTHWVSYTEDTENPGRGS